MLPQTVTTVWRTKLGTTLLIGFNNSTGLSAYFRYLGFSQSPPKRRITPSSSPVWPRGTRALASDDPEAPHHAKFLASMAPWHAGTSF